jgi:hypothetical protein
MSPPRSARSFRGRRRGELLLDVQLADESIVEGVPYRGGVIFRPQAKDCKTLRAGG